MNPLPGTGAMVYVLDDDASIRAALTDLLDSVGLAVQSFGSTEKLLAQTLPDLPSCLVLDVRMPGQSGMDFHRQMETLGLQMPVIFMTGHGDIAMGVTAMKQGAVEFLTKPFREQDLLDAIHRALAQDRVRLVQARAQAQQQTRWQSLSLGEQAVVRLVVEGQLNKQIADRLHVSEITVKVRRAQAMRKLEVGSLVELARLAERMGW